MHDALDDHYVRVARALADGKVIPFFGAGVNLCGRPAGLPWTPQCLYLPSGGELAEHLATKFGYPAADKQDLVRVSQYAATMEGLGPLYVELRKLFDAQYQSGPLHRFFATLPAILRKKGFPSCNQLIVTTNYDDALEQAFDAAGEEFEVVGYVAEDKLQRGKFWHWSPRSEPRIIDKPNKYRGLALDQRSVILKIHGAIDRKNADRDSFVITEDNYIDYLTRTDISTLIPVTLTAKLRNNHFLFLGYSLRDWNLRAILHRIWGEQKRSWKSWAIQLNPQSIDQEFWRKRDVDIYDVRLEDYIVELSTCIEKLERMEGGNE